MTATAKGRAAATGKHRPAGSRSKTSAIAPKAVALLTLAAALLMVGSGCQDQRNQFNPIRLLCPGDFDPATNRCVIDTGGDPEEHLTRA
jgi:hypothetical protein